MIAVALALASGCSREQTQHDSNAPYIEADPSALEFGPMPIGLSATLPFDIRNLGKKALTVQPARMDGADFSGSTDKVVISPGSHLVVEFSFSPTEEGERTGVAHLLSDAENDADLTIELRGLGLPQQACGNCMFPPQSYCATGTTLMTYESVGTCVDNQCQYPAKTVICGTSCDATQRKCADSGTDGGGAAADGGSDGGDGLTTAWNASGWSACSVLCGGGTRTRTVWCEQSDGTHVSDSLCSGTAPAMTSSCNTHSCATTRCVSMSAWKQCATATYVLGGQGDATDASACSASCGSKSAGCAKLVQYTTSAVCVCHSVAGLETSTFPFTQGNTSGYKIFAGDCAETGATPTTACASPSCQTTCGSMTQGQQCNNLTYFSDKMHGDDASAAACATSCGKLGAGCAKYFTDGQGHDECICHAARGIGSATGDYVSGNPKGLKIYSAECL